PVLEGGELPVPVEVAEAQSVDLDDLLDPAGEGDLLCHRRPPVVSGPALRRPRGRGWSGVALTVPSTLPGRPDLPSDCHRSRGPDGGGMCTVPAPGGAAPGTVAG